MATQNGAPSMAKSKWLIKSQPIPLLRSHRYQGYNPHSWTKDTDQTVGWKTPTNVNITFIDMKEVNSADIICHLGATPGDQSIEVKPGDSVKCQWTEWPLGHHGPVLNYLANCNGDCTKVDKTTLKFNKMTQVGLIRPYPGVPIGGDLHFGEPKPTRSGYWGADQLHDEGEIFEFKVPMTIAKGGYVLRQEKIALHDAPYEGAQPLPQCINLKVTESAGKDAFMTGTPGMELYDIKEPGFHVDIFHNLGEYTVPGPKLYDGSSSQPTDSQPTTPAPKPVTHDGAKMTDPKTPSVKSSGGEYTHPKAQYGGKPAPAKHATYQGAKTHHSAPKHPKTPEKKYSLSDFPSGSAGWTKMSAQKFLKWMQSLIIEFETKIKSSRHHARDIVEA